MRQRIRSLQKNREERTQSRQTTAEKVGKGRTMPRGNAGKAPQPEKARTSAPAEEKTLSNIRIPFPAGLKSPPAQRKPWKAAPPAPHKQKTSGTGAETGNAGKRERLRRRPESLGKRRAPSPKGKSPMRQNARLKKRCRGPSREEKRPSARKSPHSRPRREKRPRQPSMPNSSAKRTRPHRGASFRRRAMK